MKRAERFRVVPSHVPVIGLDEDGPNMMLLIAGVGMVMYQREDSGALADRLEQAAKMVRDRA